MDLRQQATKGIVWSAAQTWGARVISFLITLVLARLVSPDDFGLIAFAIVFINFAQIFLDQGFGDAIVQCSNLERKHLDTAFWINVFTGSLLTIIGLLASQPLEQLFNKPQLAPVISLLSFNFLIGSLNSVQQALLKRKLAFKSLAIRSLIATFVSGVVAIIMAFQGFGVWSLVAKMLLNNIVGVIVLWRVSDWRPGINFSLKHLKEIYKFGINIIGSNFVDFFNRNSDNFLIGYFLGTTALGYYSLAYNLLSVLTELLITVPNAVTFPVFSRLQDDITRMKQAFYEITQLQSIFAFPIFLGMLVLAPEVVILLYGQNWTQSIPVVQVLMLMGILFSIFYFYGNVINAVGKPAWRFRILTLASILNVIGFAISVRWGIIAVAMSYVIVGYLILPLYFLIIQKVIQVDFCTHIKQYLPAFFSSVAMIIFVFGLKSFLGDSLGLLISVVVLVSTGGFIYLLVLYLIKPSLYRQLINMIYMIIPRLKSRPL
jgi:O-antigen/teichoic acid export membrane protein